MEGGATRNGTLKDYLLRRARGDKAREVHNEFLHYFSQVNLLSGLGSRAISNMEQIAAASDLKVRHEYDEEEVYQAAVHFLKQKEQQPLSSPATIMEEKSTADHSGGLNAEEYINGKYDEELKEILQVTKEAEELVRASLNMPAPSTLHHDVVFQPMPPRSPPPLSVVKACEKDILERDEHAHQRLEWPSHCLQHRRSLGIAKLADKAKNDLLSKLP